MKAPLSPLSSRADDLAAGEVMKPMNRGILSKTGRIYGIFAPSPPSYNPLDWHNLQICSLGEFVDYFSDANFSWALASRTHT
jgi:hypothetical protein